MDELVNLGRGAMLIGLEDTYQFVALAELLATLEETSADDDSDIVLDLVPDAKARRNDGTS